MLVMHRDVNYYFTLYRGESEDNLPRVQQGIKPRLRWTEAGLSPDEWRQLIDPAILHFVAEKYLRLHVAKKKSAISPFVSFSRKKEVAHRRYACGKDNREKGLLITARVHIVKEYIWEDHGIICLEDVGLLVDSTGRHWLCVPYSTMALFGKDKEITKRLGIRDDEYLLLGNLDRKNYELRYVSCSR